VGGWFVPTDDESNRSSMKLPRSVFAALSALSLALSACAAEADAAPAAPARSGLLGRARLGFTADRYQLSDVGTTDATGRGYTIEASMPLASWLDFGVEHFRVGVDGPASLQIERHATLFSGTWHGLKWGQARPFVTAGGGTYAQEAGGKQKDQAWQLALGAEIPLSRRLTLTSAVTRFQAKDLDHEEWRIEAALAWHVTDHIALSLRARHGDIAGQTKYQRYAAGLTFVY
jgi:hypothetical protein